MGDGSLGPYIPVTENFLNCSLCAEGKIGRWNRNEKGESLERPTDNKSTGHHPICPLHLNRLFSPTAAEELPSIRIAKAAIRVEEADGDREIPAATAAQTRPLGLSNRQLTMLNVTMIATKVSHSTTNRLTTQDTPTTLATMARWNRTAMRTTWTSSTQPRRRRLHRNTSVANANHPSRPRTQSTDTCPRALRIWTCLHWNKSNHDEEEGLGNMNV